MWIEAIVMPRAESDADTSEFPHERGCAAMAPYADAHRFREAVLDFLQAQQLMGAVRWVSEPGFLAMVTLECSPSVLEHLQQAPGFDAGRSLAMDLHT